ncbi:MAG: penicillin-insensitive murein endopeptidase [Pseudorhodoplanes sp.]
MKRSLALLQIVLLAAWCGNASAQDKGSIDPKPLPPLANPNDPKVPARDLFGRQLTPANMQARAIGFYSKGCLSGGIALPVNGPTWQVMRLSRNRNWGHPELVQTLERLAAKAPKIGWNGLLVGDMAQARGGPMMTGHASHQVGLDADIWLTPMPNRELTRLEREEMSATNVVREDWLDVDAKLWTPAHFQIIRAAAQDPKVERILVNPAIKKALCREAGNDKSWLHKVRPWYYHNYHFHIRIGCPADSPTCKGQPPAHEDDGCGAELKTWLTAKLLKPDPTGEPPKTERRGIKLSDLPAECKGVLQAQ